MSRVDEIRAFVRNLASLIEAEPLETKVSGQAPSELHLELTYRCDSNCIMCNLGELLKEQKTPDLSLEELKSTIENSSLLKNMTYIVLSGGEPWLHPEFTDIACYLKGKYPDADILILSNLINSSAFLKKLRTIKENCGIDRMAIGSSIDGVGKVHDKIRGVEGAFESTISTALLIKKEFPSLYPTFNFTLQPANVSEIPGVYKWSRKMGAHLSYQVIVPKEELGPVKWTEDKIKEAEAGIEEVIDMIWEEEGFGNFNPEQIFSNLTLMFFLLNFEYMISYIRDPRRYYYNCPCGDKYAMISPLGELYFCPVHKNMMAGNLREHDFDSIWAGNEARKIRDFFNSYACHCWLSCTNDGMMAGNFFPKKEEIIRRLNQK